MYLPNDENRQPEEGNYSYVDPEYYTKCKEVSFKCAKCGGKEAEIIEADQLWKMIEDEEIVCPKCGRKLGYENCNLLKVD